MTVLYQNNGDIKKFIKRCMALALLPPQHVAEAVELIREAAEATEDEETMATINR
jgi:iron uptake system EfeUOB component EfeO/EfeM